MASITASQEGISAATFASSINFFDGDDHAVRVDGRDALLHRGNLGCAEAGFQGMDLAIHIGLGDVVQVDQCQPADAGARQRFRCPGTHAADADHRHVGGSSAPEGTAAIQALDAVEAALVVGGGSHAAILATTGESRLLSRPQLT
jgi:hypothetical protein